MGERERAGVGEQTWSGGVEGEEEGVAWVAYPLAAWGAPMRTSDPGALRRKRRPGGNANHRRSARLRVPVYWGSNAGSKCSTMVSPTVPTSLVTLLPCLSTRSRLAA